MTMRAVVIWLYCWIGLSVHILNISFGYDQYSVLIRKKSGYRDLLLSCRSQAENRDFLPDHIVKCEFTGTGVVLLAQPSEYDHYLMRSAVLVTEHGSRGSKGKVN